MTADTVIRYAIGFVARPLPGDERFAGMISIPYLTPSGCAAIKFRDLTAARGKYQQYAGQKARLYNSSAYFDASGVIGITEGELDAIAATEILGIPSVATPGTEAWNSQWNILFRDFSRVLIFADGDVPGRDLAADLKSALGWRASIIRCPDGEDVSSMCAAGRSAELKALIAATEGDGHGGS